MLDIHDYNGQHAVEAAGLMTPPVLRPHYTLPSALRWARVPGVTLVGDAAHLAPPDGEGANRAMQDGAELGKALAAHATVDAAVDEYEAAMYVRNETRVDDTQLIESIFGDDVPESVLALFNEDRRGR